MVRAAFADHEAPATLLGVAVLGYPDQLVDIEAVAALPELSSSDGKFDDPRLAAVYDYLEGDRPDLDHYLAIASELDARSVLDVGCGTGIFAVLLAARGYQVTGVDPAGSSLAVARGKPYADRVRWIHGDAPMVGRTQSMQVDLVTMTANGAQVFVTDDSWVDTLRAIAELVHPGGVSGVRAPGTAAARMGGVERAGFVFGAGGTRHWPRCAVA